MALRYVVHLVEDAHQPMHVGDRRDRGGNNLQLQFFRDDYTNLHQVWDSGLLRNGYRNERELVDDLIDLARKPERATGREDVSRTGSTRAWKQPARPIAFPDTKDLLRSGMRIGREYEDANLPLAVKRLSQAGVRLSEVLERLPLARGKKRRSPRPISARSSNPLPCRRRRLRGSDESHHCTDPGAARNLRRAIHWPSAAAALELSAFGIPSR